MEVTFQTHPQVTIASNVFVNVPVILQFEDTPLLEVGQFVDAGYTTRFPVFANDGKQIAVVTGSRIILTADGKNAKITQRHEQNLTVCELEGTPILEMRHNGAAALSGWAELYTPQGILIKARDAGISGLLSGGQALQIGSMSIRGSTFDGCKIGIQVRHDGIAMGVGGGGIHIGFMQT